MTPNANTRITFVSTGTVQIRQQMRSQPANFYTITRCLHTLTAGTWTDTLPVGVFLIHHPNGPILFDTGQSPLCNQPGYLPWWNIAAKSLAAC